MSYKDDFLEGMGSVYDIKGEVHFNEFSKYPDPKDALRTIWFNVGCHLDNAVFELGRENGLTKSRFKRKNLHELAE